MKYVIGTRNTNPPIYISPHTNSEGHRKITENVKDAWTFDTEEAAQSAFYRGGYKNGEDDSFYEVKAIQE